MGNIVDWALLLTTFTTLIVIIDPPGTIPVFMALTAKMDREQKRRAAVVAATTSFCVILAFAIIGKYVLNLLHISFPALQLSGGFLLFLVAMQLLMGIDVAPPNQSNGQVNVALVPLGTPLLAGPGAIVAVMVSIDQAGSEPSGLIAVLLAVIIAHLAIWATMFFSVFLSRLLGDGGILLLTRISGLLLAAIATQMMAESIYAFIGSYPG